MNNRWLAGTVLVLATLAPVTSPQERRAGASALDVGQFIAVCGYSHSAPDDPIVHPGQPGRSHSHDFLGNTTTGASSTYQSLRAGGTTCDRPKDTAAYWAPTLYQDGRPVPFLNVNVYYRATGKKASTIQAYPPDFRMIAGNASGTGPPDPAVVWFGCTTGVSASDPPACPSGAPILVEVRFPDCWDGVRTDSPDHKAHVAYGTFTNGERICPTTHPVPIPEVKIDFRYDAPGGPGLALASGPWYTMHADFLNAWDQDELERLVRVCIKGNLICRQRAVDELLP